MSEAEKTLRPNQFAIWHLLWWMSFFGCWIAAGRTWDHLDAGLPVWAMIILIVIAVRREARIWNGRPLASWAQFAVAVMAVGLVAGGVVLAVLRFRYGIAP
jgi:hypothetical protein